MDIIILKIYMFYYDLWNKNPRASQATLRTTLRATLRDLAHHDAHPLRGDLAHTFSPRERLLPAVHLVCLDLVRVESFFPESGILSVWTLHGPCAARE